MFSALGILALTLAFAVLFLTFMWIANLRHKARGLVEEVEDKPEPVSYTHLRAHETLL